MYEHSPSDRKVRQFSLAPAFVAEFEGKQPKWGPVGHFTFKRCVDVFTPVLCDDLQWRPAGDLQVGQGIIGFDAEPADTMFRYIRHGVVLHNKVEKAQTFGIELEDGTVIYATPDHGWLVKLSETDNRLYWKETKDLAATAKGGAVHLLRPFGVPWTKDATYEGGFLAAAYDGEGCLDNTDGLTFTQVGNAMLRQVEGFLDQRNVGFTKRPKSKIEGRQQVYTLLTSGRRNIYPFLGALQPPRLIEVFQEHLKEKGGGALRTSHEDAVRVIRVFDAGERDIAVLSTSTETHFTGGFASHNTYARPTCDCEEPRDCGHPSEEFFDTCKRVVEGVYNVQKSHCRRLSLPWNEPKAQQSAQDMFQRMWNFKWTPPGRGLWMMGTPFMLQKGGACINNCAFVSSEYIDEDFAGPFTFLMDMSMLGVGVGGDTRGAGKVKINTPKMGENFQVSDSREGWVMLARTVLNSFVGKGGFPALIDFSLVRSKGKRIYGFGGTASGPGPLAKLVKNIAKTLAPSGVQVVFEESMNPETGEIASLQTFFIGEGKHYKITSSGITDVFNMVGACVVAGGVRRSAEIMFGQPDDEEFRTLKDPSTLIPMDKRLGELQFDLSMTTDATEVARLQVEIADLEGQINAHPLRSHRWASNNSIFGEVGMDYAEVAQSIAKNGEPGILWLKNAQDFSRMKDWPDRKDRRAQGANPCFAGDTLIAVADGRGAVPLRQLVEEGNDVPVYSVNPDGHVEIKMARRPRMTKEFSSLVEIELDDGTTFKVTPDHKMRLLDGTKCEAKDLQPGDSLPRFTKRPEAVKKGGPKYLRVYCNTLNSTEDKVFEHRLVAQFHDPETWHDLYDEAQQSGWIKGGLVVHHKDYNPSNNSPENLEIMTFQDHAALHGQVDNAGEKNPMWGKTHTAQTRQKIGRKTSERCSDPVFLAKLAASHLAAERAEASERLTERRRQEFLAYYKEQEARTDLDTVWMEGRLHAVKTCETCQEEFIVPWRVRGQCYCTRACLNKAESHIQARKAGQAVAFADKQRQTLHDQVRVFKDLEALSGTAPRRKDWEDQCRQEGVPSRLRKAGTTENPHVLFGFDHLQQVAADYNHRVVAVRYLEVGEPVFNLSVEDNHTVGVVTTFDPTTKACSGVFAFQCVEQTLESFELCTLVETYPAHHDSYEDFQKTLKVAYLYAKTVTLIPTHEPRTNAVMNRNRRIGCSMSGIRQAVGKFGRREFLNWCDQGFLYIRDLDTIYSEWLGIPLSIKTTSVKPSGTVSLLCGATPGIHPPHSPFYIRNIRVSEHSPLCQAARDAGYKVEKDAYADATYVISFPVKTENCDKGKRDVSIWEQVALAADMQRHWADNQVSVTVTFSPEEAKEIGTVLEVFEDRLKSISFLPLGDDHGYVQAPYIEISEAEFLAMEARIQPMIMDSAKVEQEDKFCDGGACMIDSSKPQN